MHKVTDVVEIGHITDMGGSTNISVTYTERQFTNEVRNLVDLTKKVIDRLDHCLVTDLESDIQYTERYFLIDKATTLQEDSAFVIDKLLTELDVNYHTIEVTLDGYTYTKENK